MAAASTSDDDGQSVAVGPFAKLSAEEVAASADGKSRGAITNLFKSQRQFQLQAMALVLEDPEVDVKAPPDPAGFADASAWIDGLAIAESERGPHHSMEPTPGYGLNWALWLSQVPYGVWSERIAAPSMREFRHSADQLATFGILPALARFSLEVRPPWDVNDVATAMASAREGVWLNQALPVTIRPARRRRPSTRCGTLCGWSGMGRRDRRPGSGRPANASPIRSQLKQVRTVTIVSGRTPAVSVAAPSGQQRCDPGVPWSKATGRPIDESVDRRAGIARPQA